MTLIASDNYYSSSPPSASFASLQEPVGQVLELAPPCSECDPSILMLREACRGIISSLLLIAVGSVRVTVPGQIQCCNLNL